jgi:hypothetical protein
MKRIIERYQKYRTLERILEGHSAAFENRPEMIEMKAAFTASLNQVENLISKLRLPVNDIYQHRLDIRQKFQDSLHGMIAIAMNYAVKIKDKPMIVLLTKYRTRASRGNSYWLYDTGVNTLQLLNANLPQMQGLGLTEAEMSIYTTELQNYNASLQDANFDLNNRRNLRADLNKAMAECETLTKGRIDTFVEHMSKPYPTLKQEYLLARFRKRSRKKPVAKEVSTADISGTVTDGVTGDPLENATISLVNQGMSTETDEDGYYIFDELPAATYTLACSCKGFDVPESFSFDLAAGESVTHNFTLNPVALNKAV